MGGARSIFHHSTTYCDAARRCRATQDYISRLNSELEYLKRKFVIESKFKQKQEG